jgi:RNA polymerase sigma-70 factor (ECF subfamily)
VKRNKHRHEVLDEVEPVADDRPANDPQLQADASAMRHRLSTALEDLPPKLRQVVVLRDIYDLPHEAIAAELGISETAAKVRLHRARKKLREDLFPRRVEEAADAV